jgi:uncharacterized protein
MIAVMVQSWSYLAFIHWRYDSSLLQRRLPAGLRVDEMEGCGWVTLTPFDLQRFRFPYMPPVPWLSHFPETNLRTYVVGPNGPGIWFFSLDAARLHAVLGARTLYRLPYFWARMRVDRQRSVVRYKSERIHGDGHVDAELEVGPEIRHKTMLQAFLVERYRLYTLVRGKLATAEIEHRPWPLREARLTVFKESLRRAAKFHDAELPAFVNYSAGVTARIGMIHLCRNREKGTSSP